MAARGFYWDGITRRRLADDDQVEDLSSDKTWLFVYTSSLFVSFLATLVASNHLRKLGGDVFRSAVRFVTTSFLICTSVHALAGGLFYAFLITTMDSMIDDVDKAARKMWLSQEGNATSNGYIIPTLEDVLASSGSGADGAIGSILKNDGKDDGGEAAFLSKLSHEYELMPRTLTLLLCLENIFFVLGAYWIFLLTCELYKLAKRTHDRGRQKERLQIRKYASGAMAILLFFLGAGIVILCLQHGYGASYRFLNMFELVTIIASILFSWAALLNLKIKGRKNEHIHGMLLASPLYRRLKLILMVCIVFTLPYSGLQLTLMGMNENAIDNIPDYVVGIVTTLYYLFGAAQAVVMAGSQQCCMRILQPLVPQHLRNTPEWRALQGSRRVESNALHDEITAAPELPVFVNTDIESSSALWAQAPQHVIDEAQRVHDDLLRSLLPKFRGYEITTAGDAFQLAFHSIAEAVEYCLEAQLQLVQAKWPSELHGLVESTKTEREVNLKMNPLFRGLRVRMGIHDTSTEDEGAMISQIHPVTGRTLYIGASELIAREIGDLGYGGQIIVSKRIATYLRSREDEVQTPFIVDHFGLHDFSALAFDMELYQLTPKLVEGRRKIFKRRRTAEKRGLTKAKGVGVPPTPTASSNESTGEDSSVEFRAQRSPTDEERQLWARV